MSQRKPDPVPLGTSKTFMDNASRDSCNTQPHIHSHIAYVAHIAHEDEDEDKDDDKGVSRFSSSKHFCSK